MPTHIEIFTTSHRAIHSVSRFVSLHPQIDVEIHTLDTIKQLEGKLSMGLPIDPIKAKDRALERLQRLIQGGQINLKQSARSLVTAMQYGVKKYPAIIFDDELVVYGVTDLSLALMYYRHWQARGAL